MSLLFKAYCSSAFARVIGTMNFNMRVAWRKVAIESCLQYRLCNKMSRGPLKNQLEIRTRRACNVFYVEGSKIVQKLA